VPPGCRGPAGGHSVALPPGCRGPAGGHSVALPPGCRGPAGGHSVALPPGCRGPARPARSYVRRAFVPAGCRGPARPRPVARTACFRTGGLPRASQAPSGRTYGVLSCRRAAAGLAGCCGLAGCRGLACRRGPRRSQRAACHRGAVLRGCRAGRTAGRAVGSRGLAGRHPVALRPGCRGLARPAPGRTRGVPSRCRVAGMPGWRAAGRRGESLRYCADARACRLGEPVCARASPLAVLMVRCRGSAFRAPPGRAPRIRCAATLAAVALRRRTAPSHCAVALRRRTAPSHCAVALRRRTAPSRCAVALRRRAAVPPPQRRCPTCAVSTGALSHGLGRIAVLPHRNTGTPAPEHRHTNTPARRSTATSAGRRRTGSVPGRERRHA
jgi:hypothetical protein